MRPRTLRRSDVSSDLAAAEWIEDATGGKKVFNWEEKNGDMDLCFIRSHYKCLAMRLMCVFKVNYMGRGHAAGELVMKDWH